MRIVYTDEALRNLDEALTYIARNYPTALEGFRRRLRTNETVEILHIHHAARGASWES